MPESRLQRETRKRKPFDCPEQEAYLNLVRTHDRLALGTHRLFKAHGLSPSGYNVLRILRGAGTPLPSLEIAQRMVYRVPDITRLVDRLEQERLVRRRRCARDRRVVYVELTVAGGKRLAALDKPVLALHRAQLGHLSRAELRTLSRLLEKARDGAVEADPDG